MSNFLASPVNVGYDLTDSDGVPLYSDGSDTYSPGVFLKLTQISDLIMPEIEDISAGTTLLVGAMTLVLCR